MITTKKYNKISNDLGNIYKLVGEKTLNYDVKEIYISEIQFQKTKGWKNHTVQISTVFVISGSVQINIEDADEIVKVVLHENSTDYLEIRPGTWFSFQGLSIQPAKLLNVASIFHDPSETLTK